MEKVILSERIPIKLWLNDIEEGALEQAKNLANLPFAFKHIALMPDCHQGYGMPIGGVLATKGVIIPNAVGVDIGCGMCAVKTSLNTIDFVKLKEIINEIRKVIPLGFKHQKIKQNVNLLPSLDKIHEEGIVHREFENAREQVGTLGGGNHFIEIQKGSDNHIWIMIHSGSRNIGYKVADYYNKLAISLNNKWHSPVPTKYNLAFLPLDSQEAKCYIKEMQYCIDFALCNRTLMMNNIIEIFHEIFPGKSFSTEPMINIAHNYARAEIHYNTNVIVHRKGATSAKKGEIGIIPGSQGTKSYIVKGKGNKESFCSCSHGAGRLMGRKQAQKHLDLKKEIKFLNEQNIIHSIKSKKDLDEAPSAYKNINNVIRNQKDLVDIVIKLTPLAVIKG